MVKKKSKKVKEVIIAKVFIVDGIIDYAFKYENSIQATALITYLEKIKLEVLSKLFPVNI